MGARVAGGTGWAHGPRRTDQTLKALRTRAAGCTGDALSAGVAGGTDGTRRPLNTLRAGDTGRAGIAFGSRDTRRADGAGGPHGAGHTGCPRGARAHDEVPLCTEVCAGNDADAGGYGDVLGTAVADDVTLHIRDGVVPPAGPHEAGAGRAGGACRSRRPGDALGACAARSARCAGIAGYTDDALWAGGADLTGRTRGADRAGCADRACIAGCTDSAGGAGLTGRARGTGVTLAAGRAYGTRHTRCADSAGCSRCSRGAGRPGADDQVPEHAQVRSGDHIRARRNGDIRRAPVADHVAGDVIGPGIPPARPHKTRAGGTHGAGRAGGARHALWTLRAGIAFEARGPDRARRTHRSGQTLRAVDTRRAGHAHPARVAGGADRAGDTGAALRTGRPGAAGTAHRTGAARGAHHTRRADGACRAHGTGIARGTGRPDRAANTSRARDARGAHRTGRARGAGTDQEVPRDAQIRTRLDVGARRNGDELRAAVTDDIAGGVGHRGIPPTRPHETRAGRARCTGRSSGARSTLSTGGAIAPLCAGGAGWTGWPGRTRGSLRAGHTGCARGTRQTLRSSRTRRALSTRRAGCARNAGTGGTDRTGSTGRTRRACRTHTTGRAR